MKTRIGKIARLPRAVRDELNARLHDGEPGPHLLDWLNVLPAVQTVLAAEFDGRPINAQNLSDWKLGGYRDWVAHQETMELAERLAEEAVELQPEKGRPPLTDTLALWLAARYAVATRELVAKAGPEQWRQLRELCADVVDVRRGDHMAERLRLERERWNKEQAEERRHREAAAKMAPLNAMLLANSVGNLMEMQMKKTGCVPPEVFKFLAETAPDEARAAGVPEQYFDAPASPIKSDQGESR